MEFFSNKTVVVTGCCGTVGKELIRQLCTYCRAGRLIGLDNNESELFYMEEELGQDPNISFFLADVRDRDKLTKMFRGAEIIFHTAAFKHVTLCERSPFEAVQTNILGVRNVIAAAESSEVQKVIFTSSDKAVNPTNVMGTSKLMGERLMTAANQMTDRRIIFASTRFGNVLGSRGSVIPLFKKQIREGGPVTLTDPRMTRFIMSVEDAARLVLDTAVLACGGEVFVTKMPVCRIEDLAHVMIRHLAPIYGHDPETISIEIIGAKPGEKMYEELLSQEETRRTWELEKYFVILPAFRDLYKNITYQYPNIVSRSVTKEYNSSVESPLLPDELAKFLIHHGLI